MTRTEYDNIREMIESRFRKDMAALERVWFTINGCNPPDSPLALETREKEPPPYPLAHGEGLRSAESIGAQSAARIADTHRRPYKKRGFGLSDEEKKERKKAYMKAYWLKRRKGSSNGHELSPGKFNKFLANKPHAAGGIG